MNQYFLTRYRIGHFHHGLITIALFSLLSTRCTPANNPVEPFLKIHGVCFSPVMTGQTMTSPISEDQIRSRLEIIAPYVEWIRTISTGGDFRNIGRIAHELGLKTVISAWIDTDLENNERQIATLIEVALEGQVDIAVVGGEVLLRKELSLQDLISYVTRVKASLPNIPVSTVDSYYEIYLHPEIIAAVDVVMVNFYPFWEGLAMTQSVAHIAEWYEKLMAISKGKPLIIAETGWPSYGDPYLESIPTEQNAADYLNDFVSWARPNDYPFFYFEAFDEGWKIEEGSVGPHWGIWDETGTMKPDMNRVFIEP